MKQYHIEVEDELDMRLNDGAQEKGMSVERFIAEILNRFTLSPHIMDSKEIENGYKECGEINLELANL